MRALRVARCLRARGFATAGPSPPGAASALWEELKAQERARWEAIQEKRKSQRKNVRRAVAEALRDEEAIAKAAGLDVYEEQARIATAGDPTERPASRRRALSTKKWIFYTFLILFEMKNAKFLI